MKLSRPVIPVHLEVGTRAYFMEGEVEAVRFLDSDVAKATILALDIDGVLFEKVSFLQAQLPRLTAKDVVMKQTDLSFAVLTDGAFNRAEFTNCRMTGVDLNKTSLHDVVFRGCKLDMANFRFTDIRRAKFVDCTLVETDFLGATLHDVAFESCTLEKTIFDRAQCKNVDLRTSQLVEISGWGSLKGASIDGAQLMAAAPYLAHELGIIVK